MRQSHQTDDPPESLEIARERLALLRENLGARHPEYASALNQFALRLIMIGDPASAEPLLREALEIRLEAFGSRHPDFATNLGSLAGLLWARGELDEAEEYLRQTAAIRAESLGPRHPKTLVSLRSLEQLLEAKRQAAEDALDPFAERSRNPELAATVDTPPYPQADPAETVPWRASPDSANRSEAFERELEILARVFADIGDRMVASAKALLVHQILPPDRDVDDWISARNRFRTLQADVRRHANDLSLIIGANEDSCLEKLADFLPSIREAERRHRETEELRRRVVACLDDVAALRCRVAPERERDPLVGCRESAVDLRRRVESMRDLETCDEVSRIATGDSPFVALLNLVRADDSTPDEVWADGFAFVEREFGRLLAVFAARSKLIISSSRS